MSSFRRRRQRVLHIADNDYHFVSHLKGDEVLITSQFGGVPYSFIPPSPSLDELLASGAQVKSVPTDGILDSYDANDIPNLDSAIDKVAEKVKKSKTKSKKETVNE